MARPFTKEEAKALISYHQELLAQADSISDMGNSLRQNIVNSAGALKDKQLNDFLSTVPVSMLNDIEEGTGIKVKTLEDNGKNFVSDLRDDNAQSLSKISGISEASGQKIINVARRYEAIARKNIKVRISSDNRDDASTNLIRAIYNYFYFPAHIEKCRQSVFKETEKIESSIEDINVAINSFSWIFLSGEKKKKATEAFEYLTSLKTNGYADAITTSASELDKLYSADSDTVWKDYIANVIKYNTSIEKNVPGYLGTDDDLHGLPEELAKKIQEQQVFKNGLKCELRNYQELGVKYALHQERIILGDEMGLGKTVQAIATMVSLRCTGETHFVVVCPASVISNWCREIVLKSTLDVIKVHGSDKEACFKRWLKEGGVAVTTYETTGIFDFGEDSEFKFSEIIVDEAHYIKNPSAKRTVNVKNICKHAERIMFMTGTALENRVEEMIELISILDADVANKLRPMSFMSAAKEFRTVVAPVYYRRRREDVLTELPEKTEAKEWCTLTKEEEKVYEKSVLEGKYTESRRVSWNVEDLANSSKAQRLLELVEQAKEEERKVIVFSFFLDTMKRAVELLGDRCMPIINGSVPPQKRQEIIDEFEKAPVGAVLPAQIQAGGTGLNIQSASVVIILEPQFKPSIENQAISRAYRMGQARNVLVYRLLCENTIDEKITELLEEKQGVFDAFADESEAGKEFFELSDKSFGDLIEEEIERIKNKQAGDSEDEPNTLTE